MHQRFVFLTIVSVLVQLPYYTAWSLSSSIPSQNPSLFHSHRVHRHCGMLSALTLKKNRIKPQHDSFTRSSRTSFGMRMDSNEIETTNDMDEMKLTTTSRNNNDNNDHPKKKKKIYNPVPGYMSRKTVIITGAASGLGLESAKRLSVSGANVVVTARSKEKTEWAVKAVMKHHLQQKESVTTPNDEEYGHVIGIELDLEDLNSVKTFSERYEQAIIMNNDIPSTVNFNKKIDVLMNNAGIGGIPTRQLTVDGYERIFQANHLGHFVLTSTLFPFFNRNEGCRVINVSSLAHSAAHLANSKVMGLDLDNIVMADLEYTLFEPYQQTKLANILFTQELQRRANAAGMQEWFTTVSLEPGIVATNIWRYLVGKDPRPSPQKGDNDTDTVDISSTAIPGGKLIQWLVSNLFYRILTKTEMGANTQIWLSSESQHGSDGNHILIEAGCHYDGNMQKKELKDFAQDAVKARLLWKKSEECAGIKFTL